MFEVVQIARSRIIEQLQNNLGVIAQTKAQLENPDLTKAQLEVLRIDIETLSEFVADLQHHLEMNPSDPIVVDKETAIQYGWKVR